MPDSSQIRLVEAILALPPDLKPSYKVIGVQDVSFGSVRRYVVSIGLPPNLKKETVEQNFKQAILQIYREKAANAITVWGFKEGDNIAQLSTVGEAVFAPNGVWENAGENNKDLQNYKTTINLKDSYFNPQKVLSAGDSITLSAHNTDDKKPETVRVWKDETQSL